MNVRGPSLARALVRATGVQGPGRLIIVVGKDGNVAEVVKEERLGIAALDHLSASISPERPMP